MIDGKMLDVLLADKMMDRQMMNIVYTDLNVKSKLDCLMMDVVLMDV